MTKTGPVAKVRIHTTGGNAGIAWSAVAVNDYDSLPPLPEGTRLYAEASKHSLKQADAVAHLAALVGALDKAFISSWQSTAAWDRELEAAREYLKQEAKHDKHQTQRSRCRSGYGLVARADA